MFGNETCWIAVHLLKPNTVFVDFGFDVTVCRTAYTKTYGATCAVARKTYHSYVVGKSFSAELCAETYLVSLFQKFCFEVKVAESPSRGIAGGGKIVVIVY